ncbi:MAG: hypothetical protein NZM38_02110 [Cytophagales bacterium]|nr:hypothetical protein [Cytophagales bacterium]MDW8383546.1 hypothetical protein [Flammeovirgaceae bacterium]
MTKIKEKLLICFLGCSLPLFAQLDLQKRYYPVRENFLSLIAERPRHVRYNGVLIGVQNFEPERKVMQVWVPSMYISLLKTDATWAIDRSEDLILMNSGTKPYDYFELEKNPIEIHRLVHLDEQVADYSFITKEHMKKARLVEEAAREIYRYFLQKKSDSVLAKYINPQKKYVVLLEHKHSDEEQDRTEVLNEKDIKMWFEGKRLIDTKFSRTPAFMVTTTRESAHFNLEGIEFLPPCFFITDLYFTEVNNKLYLTRIGIYTIRKEEF